jgi:drug/metabolite transporter (DMT)-like permease
MQFTNQQAAEVVVLIAAVVMAFATLIYRRIFIAPRQRAAAQALAARELANIVEEVTPTNWGSFCIGMIVLTAIGAFFAFSAATTVFQQIEAGVVWIGGTIMFGIGAMMNQKRTYTVYRSVHRTE